MTTDETRERRTLRDLHYCREIYRNYFPERQVSITSVKPIRTKYIIIGKVDGKTKRVELSIDHPALRQYDSDADSSSSDSSLVDSEPESEASDQEVDSNHDSDSDIPFAPCTSPDCDEYGPLGSFCPACEDSGHIFAN